MQGMEFLLARGENECVAIMQAHRFHRVYPRTLLMIVGWYPPKWWEGNAAEQRDLMARYDCSVADRESVVEYIIAPRKAGRTYTDASALADSGIVSSLCTLDNSLFCRVIFAERDRNRASL